MDQTNQIASPFNYSFCGILLLGQVGCLTGFKKVVTYSLFAQILGLGVLAYSLLEENLTIALLGFSTGSTIRFFLPAKKGF